MKLSLEGKIGILNTRQHGSRYQSRPKPQHVHRSHHTDGDVCIDRHNRAIFQGNAASHELSALYHETEGMSGLAWHIHKDIEFDVECIIRQFSRQKTGA